MRQKGQLDFRLGIISGRLEGSGMLSDLQASKPLLLFVYYLVPT
jgi:hypothetical protein